MLLRLGAALRSRPPLVVPLFLAVYGYGTIDVADFYQLSAHPLQLNPETSKQFLHASALPYFIGYPLAATIGPRAAFVVVMIGGVVAAVAALRRLTRLRYGARANDAMLMLLATPILIVLTQYLGKSDGYLIASFFVLVSVSNPGAEALAALFVVLSHREMGVLLLASAWLLGLRRPGAWMLGAVAGLVMVFAYHHFWLAAPPQSRADLGVSYVRDAVALTLSTPVLHVLWTFGPFWWCVTRAWPIPWRGVVVLVVALVLASATLDFTRVFTIVSLPLAIALVDRIVDRLDRGPEQTWLAYLPLFPFVQAHLLSSLVFDSRLAELVPRLWR